MKLKKIIAFLFIIIILNYNFCIISKAENEIDDENIGVIQENSVEEDNNVKEENSLQDVQNIYNNDNIENQILVEDDENIKKDQEDLTDEIVISEQSGIKENNYNLKNGVFGIQYVSHVQDYGWQNEVQNGEQSGTTGENKKIEAIKIQLINNYENVSVAYSTYLENYGWQDEVFNGQESGTVGQNRKMFGIKIRLENTNTYSIIYRVHIQDYGWQNWKIDGDIAGKISEQKKIEAIQINIIPKQAKNLSISYCSHVQDIGWTDYVMAGEQSGTTGQNKKIEAIKLELNNTPYNMNVKYRVFVENQGWQEWRYNGWEAGTTGKNKKVYGLRIQLEGTTEYSIQYRAHIQDIGWSDWKKDGEVVGELAQNLKIEAIEVRIEKQNVAINNNLEVEYYSVLAGNSINENKIEKDGEVSGTEGENRRMEAIQIQLNNANNMAHIKYQTHIQDIGWINWVQDGQVSGYIDSNLKIEAIKIELEGLDNYTVEYRAHVENIGWTDWYIDGEIAGTTGRNLKVEAIQIRLKSKYKRNYRGIDISQWQNEVNFDQIKADNQLDFIIARIGWYSETNSILRVDREFERNYREIKSKNIPMGAYFYSYAMSIDEVVREANSVVDYLNASNQKSYELPIFYDIENDSQKILGKQAITDMAITFCEILKSAGYKVGIYSYTYWLENYMEMWRLPEDYSIWGANYGNTNTGTLPSNIYEFSGKYDIWQYTSKGTVNGIDGEVDMNIGYKRYF